MQKRLKAPSWARAEAALCSTVRLGWVRTTHYREESLLEFLNLKLAKMRPYGDLHSGQNVPPLSRSIEGTKLPIRVVAVINEMAEWPIINRLWVNANHISGHRRIIRAPRARERGRTQAPAWLGSGKRPVLWAVAEWEGWEGWNILHGTKRLELH